MVTEVGLPFFGTFLEEFIKEALVALSNCFGSESRSGIAITPREVGDSDHSFRIKLYFNWFSVVFGERKGERFFFVCFESFFSRFRELDIDPVRRRVFYLKAFVCFSKGKRWCIGCRYCMMACPYKARSFVHEDTTNQKAHAPRGKGTVESCTLCVHRVDAGRIPACVEACTKDGNKAMVFGDLKDPNSEINKQLASAPTTQLRPDLNLNTGVRYRGI